MKKNTLLLTAIVVFIFGFLLGMFISSRGGYAKAAQKEVVQKLISEKLVRPGTKVEVKTLEKLGKLSAVRLEVEGKEDTLYTNSKGTAVYQKLYDENTEKEQAEAAKKAEAEALARAAKVPAITKTEAVLGSKDADVTIYEYSDFECPFCKRFYQIPEQIVKNNKGKVNLVFRHFPLSFHDPLATDEALATECANEQGKFWAYHDKIFAETKSNGNGLKKSDLYAFAKKLGLKSTQFKTCLDTKKYADKVSGDIASGMESGVTGTPGSIIKNNKTGAVKFINGASDLASVQAIVDELLAQ